MKSSGNSILLTKSEFSLDQIVIDEYCFAPPSQSFPGWGCRFGPHKCISYSDSTPKKQQHGFKEKIIFRDSRTLEFYQYYKIICTSFREKTFKNTK